MHLLRRFSYYFRNYKSVKLVVFFLLALVALYAYGYYKTFSPEYEAAAARGITDPVQLQREASKIKSLRASGGVETDVAGALDVGEPTGALHRAAGKWVRAVNEANPDAILYHDMGNFGMLYLVLGEWWTALETDQQAIALNNLADAWRQYLWDATDGWPATAAVEPGLVILDQHGVIACDFSPVMLQLLAWKPRPQGYVRARAPSPIGCPKGRGFASVLERLPTPALQILLGVPSLSTLHL